jgi:hypothetical protein
MPEEDLIIGEPEGEEINWVDERTEARNDIDSAIYAFEFLEQVDNQSPDILRWKLKNQMMEAKRKCLLILFRSIDDLMIEEES